MKMLLKDRRDAGAQLAMKLARYSQDENAIILGLPRGGVPVAAELARELLLPMDVFLVRKLGVPGHSELAMGAVAMGDVCVINHDVVHGMGIPESAIENVRAREEAELMRRNQAYRDDKPAPKIKGRTVILVDDGIATGATVHAAIAALKRAKAGKIVLAVPVSPREAFQDLSEEVDEFECLMIPAPFYGVGQWYQDFSQTSDEEVIDMLQKADEDFQEHCDRQVRA